MLQSKNFKEKYLKYKIKYKTIKQKMSGGTINNINNNNLSELYNKSYTFLNNICFILFLFEEKENIIFINDTLLTDFEIDRNCVMNMENVEYPGCFTIKEYVSLLYELRFLFIFNESTRQFILDFYLTLEQLLKINIDNINNNNEHEFREIINRYNELCNNFKSILCTKIFSQTNNNNISEKRKLLQNFPFIIYNKKKFIFMYEPEITNDNNKDEKKVENKEKKKKIDDKKNYDGLNCSNNHEIYFKLNNDDNQYDERYFCYDDREYFFYAVKRYIEMSTFDQLVITETTYEPDRNIGQHYIYCDNKYYIFTINLKFMHIYSFCTINSQNNLFEDLLCYNEYEKSQIKDYIVEVDFPRKFYTILYGIYHMLIIKKIRILINQKYNDISFKFKIIDCNNDLCYHSRIISKPIINSEPIGIECLMCNASTICNNCNKTFKSDNCCTKNNIISKSETDSEDYVKNNTKKCPNCDGNIEKDEGCNHMHCTYCDIHFCWICNTQYSRNEISAHYQDGDATRRCRGEQINETPIERQERRDRERLERQERERQERERERLERERRERERQERERRERVRQEIERQEREREIQEIERRRIKIKIFLEKRFLAEKEILKSIMNENIHKLNDENFINYSIISLIDRRSMEIIKNILKCTQMKREIVEREINLDDNQSERIKIYKMKIKLYEVEKSNRDYYKKYGDQLKNEIRRYKEIIQRMSIEEREKIEREAIEDYAEKSIKEEEKEEFIHYLTGIEYDKINTIPNFNNIIEYINNDMRHMYQIENEKIERYRINYPLNYERLIQEIERQEREEHENQEIEEITEQYRIEFNEFKQIKERQKRERQERQERQERERHIPERERQIQERERQRRARLERERQIQIERDIENERQRHERNIKRQKNKKETKKNERRYKDYDDKY